MENRLVKITAGIHDLCKQARILHPARDARTHPPPPHTHTKHPHPNPHPPLPPTPQTRTRTHAVTTPLLLPPTQVEVNVRRTNTCNTLPSPQTGGERGEEGGGREKERRGEEDLHFCVLSTQPQWFNTDWASDMYVKPKTVVLIMVKWTSPTLTLPLAADTVDRYRRMAIKVLLHDSDKRVEEEALCRDNTSVRVQDQGARSSSRWTAERSTQNPIKTWGAWLRDDWDCGDWNYAAGRDLFSLCC